MNGYFARPGNASRTLTRLQPMKRSLLSLLSVPLLVLAAFGGQDLRAQDLDSRFVGTWVVDNKKLLEINEAAFEEMVPPDAPAEIGEQMMKMFKELELTLTLQADGTATGVSVTPDPFGGEGKRTSEATGSWKMDGDEAAITMQGEDQPEPQTQNAKIDGDYLIISVDNGPADIKIPLMRETPSFVGTWRLDSQKMLEMNRKTFASMLPPDMPEEARAMAQEQMAEMFTQLKLEIVLTEDGKANAVMETPAMPGMEQKEEPATGTWSVEGREVTISLKGEDDDEAEAQSGTYEDGYLVMAINQNGLNLKMPLKRVVTSTVAGTWTIDNELMIEMNVESMVPADTPAEMRAQIMSMIEKMFSEMSMEIVLSKDGKATGVTTMPGQGEDRVSGTWKADGNKVSITMKSADEEDAQTATGELKGDLLVLTMENDGQTVRLPLRRR